MSVKNGMASSVSFCMMPNTRSGSAWNRLEGNNPSSMPTSPENKPVAASANATGNPLSRNVSSVTNMNGTKLAVRNSIMSVHLACHGGSLCLFGQQCLGQFFFV